MEIADHGLAISLDFISILVTTTVIVIVKKLILINEKTFNCHY